MPTLPNLRPGVIRPLPRIRAKEPLPVNPHISPEILHIGVYQDDKIYKNSNYTDALNHVRETGEGFVWVGMHQPTPATMNAVADVYGLHPLITEDILDAHQRPKLERYDDALLLVLKTVAYSTNTEAIVGRELIQTGEIMLITGPDYIISIRRGNHTNLRTVLDRIESTGIAQLALGPTVVMHAIADFVVDTYVDMADFLEKIIENAEEEIFSPQGSVTIDGIYQLKREVIEIRRAIGPLSTPLSRLTLDEVGSIPKEVRRYFRDVQDHHNVAADQIASFDEVLSTLVDATLAKASIQQNTDMRKISSWAAIASLPTMVAGIYGMNFDNIPELHWKYGYFLILFFMFSICAIMWRTFRRNEWL